VLGLVYARFGGWGAAEQPLAPPGERANGGGHRYADPASCAGCHGGIASTYALTGMARSLSKVAAGSGSKAPDGPSVDVAPGKYKYSIRFPGQPAQTDEVEVKADEIWGLMIGPGGVLAIQAY